MKQTGLSQFGGKKGTPPWRFRGEHKTWNAELGTSSTWNGKNRTWNGVPTRGTWNGKKSRTWNGEHFYRKMRRTSNAELGTTELGTANIFTTKNTILILHNVINLINLILI